MLGDANQQTMSSELNKVYMKSDIQIIKENEKLNTMLSQINASQNSRQTIGNTHNGFQPFAYIMTEKLVTFVSICGAKCYYSIL